MAQNHKYGTITTERGNIGEGEPVFLLRARDPLAVDAIIAYLDAREHTGASPEIMEDLESALEEILEWRRRNGTKPADQGE